MAAKLFFVFWLYCVAMFCAWGCAVISDKRHITRRAVFWPLYLSGWLVRNLLTSFREARDGE